MSSFWNQTTDESQLIYHVVCSHRKVPWLSWQAVDVSAIHLNVNVLFLAKIMYTYADLLLSVNAI